jgi:sugar lactone lactonase YvrE
MSAELVNLPDAPLATGFSFVEGPRWHDGAVYVTHIFDDAVERVELDGSVTRVAELPGSPISTSFTSDGTMLVCGMSVGKLWRVVDGVVEELVDLKPFGDDDWGDLVVDEHDTVYIANQGFSWPERVPALEDWNSTIHRIAPGGSLELVADGFLYANGLAITPDGAWMLVAESFGHRLWRLPIGADGSLGERELVVQFEEHHNPDGLCSDAEGAAWSANAPGREVVRCTLDGEVTHRISTGDQLAIGCILGGDDGHDLFVTTAPTAHRAEASELRTSSIWRLRADVPAGGRP